MNTAAQTQAAQVACAVLEDLPPGLARAAAFAELAGLLGVSSILDQVEDALAGPRAVTVGHRFHWHCGACGDRDAPFLTQQAAEAAGAQHGRRQCPANEHGASPRRG